MGGILLALLRVSFPQFDFGVVKSEDVGKSGEGYLAEISKWGGTGDGDVACPTKWIDSHGSDGGNSRCVI